MLNPTLPIVLTPTLTAHIDAEPTMRTMRAIRDESSKGNGADELTLTVCACVVRSFEGADAPAWPEIGNGQALEIRKGILLDFPVSLLNAIAEACAARLKPDEGDSGK